MTTLGNEPRFKEGQRLGAGVMNAIGDFVRHQTGQHINTSPGTLGTSGGPFITHRRDQPDVQWAITQADWVWDAVNTPFVTCKGSSDSSGTAQTAGTFPVLLPRPLGRIPTVLGDPAIFSGENIRYMVDEQGDAYCIESYMGQRLGDYLWSATSTVALGYDECDGAAVNIAGRYNALWNIIGFAYGNPGGGQFNLPDVRQHSFVGTTGAPPFNLGTAGGAPTHGHADHGTRADVTVTGAATALTIPPTAPQHEVVSNYHPYQPALAMIRSY